MIKISKTKLKGVLKIIPGVFKDRRGRFLETYNKKVYQEKGININFVEDDISVSKKNVLRGIHADSKDWKLYSCLRGKLYFVVVNCDKNSRQFGQWQAFIVSGENRLQLLIPPKYGTAFLVLSNEAYLTYKQSEYYDRKRQSTYKWSDKRFKVKWPIKNPVLSKRDKYVEL